MADFTKLNRTAASQHGVLTTHQLHAAGFNTKRVQRLVNDGFLRRSHRGILIVAGSRPSWDQEVCAASLAAGPVAASSVRSAARSWKFRSVDSEIDVSVRYPRRLRLDGVVVHRSRDLLPSDITVVDGIPTTTPDRTICDLGLIFPKHEVARILRHAIADGLVNRRDLWRIRYRNGKQGRNGVGVLGEALGALPDQAEQAESGPEVLFLEVCEEYGLPQPSIQVPVVVAGKAYRLDFAYPLHRVFIEIDGADNHGELHQIANDDGRQNDLVAHGWSPLRFTHDQLVDEPGISARRVRALLDARSQDL